ncbi:sialoadhesin-like isoform X2 [Betta splendens]|uniref:Sialoadhesin-like isoform X2 n=1 Tax=Betta splendens TaxID=158456 RepID=A0A9W2XCE2_BETSP|nr:sialoadhesin-like isoform X2 [Betta splendens]
MSVSLMFQVFLNVSPNRQQFFIRGSVSLTCVNDGCPADGWTVMKHSGGHNMCDPGLRDFGTVSGSSVVLTDLDNKDISFYWCENSDGRMSEYTSIWVEDHVILDIPALPVMTGSNLTLRCLSRDGSAVAAFFFINGTLVGPEPKAELKIASVQKSDEGAYACTAVMYGRSPVSFLRVRDPPSAITALAPSTTHLQVSLKVSPDLQQFVKGSSVSVSCVEDGQTVDGWTVKRTIDNKTLECGAYCSMSERWVGSSCDLNGHMTFTGVYWCETRSGLRTEHVTVTITDRPLILEIPALPLMTGSDVTLLCRHKGSSVAASFYKNHSLVGSGSELIIRRVQQSDEGLYSCAIDEYESVWSWLRVKGFAGFELTS